MEQDDLLLKKLRSIPEYQEFQKERKIYALRAMLFSIFFFGAVTLDIIRSVTHGTSVCLDVIFMMIALVCLAVSIGSMFFAFLKKPTFIIEGITKKVQRITYRGDYLENLYLVSNGTIQEYWGKYVTDFLCFHGSKKSHAIGEKVLCFCFSMGGDKWIVSEQ